MRLDEARRVLGLTDGDAVDRASLRSSYRRLMRVTHPDVNSRPDAQERTTRLTLAYELLVGALTSDTRGPDGERASRPGGVRDSSARDGGAGTSGATGRPRPPRAPERGTPRPTAATPTAERIAIRRLDDESISVHAPADETFMLLLEAAHELGETSYLDRMTGLVEVIVEFVEAPTSSVLFSMQGRGDGTTEVFCTVEPLSGGDAPPTSAVTRLAISTLRSVQRPD